MNENEILCQESVKMMLSHFPLFEDSSRFGVSFEESCEAQMIRVDLIREKIKDRNEITSFIDKLF